MGKSIALMEMKKLMPFLLLNYEVRPSQSYYVSPISVDI
jgi:hypothetical protein